MCFFCLFGVLVSLLGKRGGGLVFVLVVRLFVAVRALVCVTFSLPPGVGGWLRLLLVALPGLVCLPFCSQHARTGDIM